MTKKKKKKISKQARIGKDNKKEILSRLASAKLKNKGTCQSIINYYYYYYQFDHHSHCHLCYHHPHYYEQQQK